MKPSEDSYSKIEDTIVTGEEIHKTYLFGLEGVAALRGVSISINQGEFVIILGNSGGGKTSLLNILGTIDKLTKVTHREYLGQFIIIWVKNQGCYTR